MTSQSRYPAPLRTLSQILVALSASLLMTSQTVHGLEGQKSESTLRSSSQSKPKNLIETENSFKGYQKRSRLSLISTQSVSPSQLHEVYGSRFEGAFQIRTASQRQPNRSAKKTSPTFAIRGTVGGDTMVLGVGIAESRGHMTTNILGLSESTKETTVSPEFALTLAKNFTIGASVHMTNLVATEDSPVLGERRHNWYFNRPVFGISFHEERFEIGGFAAGAVRAADRNPASHSGPTFSLATQKDSATRSLYIAPHVGGFIRGNFSNRMSAMAKVTFTEYDREATAAIPLFAKYKVEDRVSAQLQGSWWYSDRSRIIGNLTYLGATVSESGPGYHSDTSLGYRIANIGGVSMDAVRRIGNQTFIGFTVGYQRGNRDETVAAGRFAADEEHARLGTSITTNL